MRSFLTEIRALITIEAWPSFPCTPYVLHCDVHSKFRVVKSHVSPRPRNESCRATDWRPGSYQEFQINHQDSTVHESECLFYQVALRFSAAHDCGGENPVDFPPRGA